MKNAIQWNVLKLKFFQSSKDAIKKISKQGTDSGKIVVYIRQKTYINNM